MFTCNKTPQKTHTLPKFPPRFADHFAPMWCEESPARHHQWFIFICSIGLPQFISDFPENCQWFCMVLEEKPTTLLQTNIAMESGPLIHSKWLHYQRLSTVPKTGSLSLAQGIEGSKNRPTISESSWGLYFKIAIIHWLAKTEPAEAPALPADSRPLVSAAAPAAPAVSSLPRQRPRRVVGAAGTGVLCFDGFDHQKWGDYRGKHHGKYMENTG